MINGNAVGGIVGYGKTFVLEDDSGNQLVGTVVEDLTVFDADPLTDIRTGKKAVTDQGVVVGSKDIPAYRTLYCRQLILPGESFLINELAEYSLYDYTKLQCIIAKFNTTFDDSVFTDKIVLSDKVYPVNSIESLSDVSKNEVSKSIEFNITNDSEDMYVIHGFMYREEL